MTAPNPTATGSRRTAPATVDELAPHFPELEILELIGVGGMGAVYKARQPQLDRIVALKILSHDLASDPAFAERFNREARVLARLSHPNIVGIFDFGTAGPYCYFLMEYVDGVNLRQAMQAGRFSPAESLAMVEDVCAALKFAHEEGILHRDIKPENVLIDAKGRVKIADFGIAKLVGDDPQHDVTLTLQGSILGSPHYMAPEQIETPGDVDQRADIYSLGVVLYEMLTGELPIGRFALPSQKAAMDARIDEIVLRTLEKEREARFQSAEEFSTSVGALAQGPPAPPNVTEAQPTGERPTAKFSLTSAILTGASLLLGVVFFWGFFSLNQVQVSSTATPPEVAEEISSRLPKIAMMIVVVVGFLSTALMGFIFGCKALGDIRESGGWKRGLGFATFAAIAWPVLFLGVLTMFPLAFAAEDGAVDSPVWIIQLLSLVAWIFASFLLVRGVVRWAGGVDDGSGRRRHPGIGSALLQTLAAAILVPSIAVVVWNAFPPGQEVRPSELVEGPKTRTALTSDEIRWRLGQPEVTLPLILQPDQKASLRVYFKNAEGDTRSLDAGDVREGLMSPDTVTTLEIGSELYDTLQRLVIVKSGRSSKSVRSLEDLRGFRFNQPLPAQLSFDAPGTYTFDLAILPGDDSETPKETLILEITVTEIN